ncbi:MAG: SDR family oxidoreductase [Candidatus Helarchaeota archaeon]
MDFNGKKILVTGVAGFIGSNIALQLLSYNCSIIGLDNFSTGRKENIKDCLANPKFSLIKGDIRDFAFLKKSLKDIDIIFHEAALGSVPRSVEDPLTTNNVNITGTLHLLMLARILDIERFIFASSSSVYGEKEILPKKESMATAPISPYAVSKLAAENYVLSFYKTYGLKTVSLRYFNVYGPRQSASPYSGVIAIFISRAINNKPLVIFGKGEQTRDFTFVQDVVHANLLAATEKKSIGQVYNVGTSTQTSIKELAHSVLELSHKSHLDILYEPPRAGDVLHSRADITRIKTELGFTPKYDLHHGLIDTIKWFQQGGLS